MTYKLIIVKCTRMMIRIIWTW